MNAQLALATTTEQVWSNALLHAPTPRFASPEQLSAHMRRIRKKDTGPELAVRRLVHGMGYRYRLHRRDLPGTPDLVFPSRPKVIFVHG